MLFECGTISLVSIYFHKGEDDMKNDKNAFQKFSLHFPADKQK